MDSFYLERWKTKLRRQANNCCQACGDGANYPSNRPLDIHHKDSDKSNNLNNNVLVLCRKCHQDIHRIGYRWLNKRGC